MIIGGECQIQNEKTTMENADGIRQIAKNLNIEIIFKASYSKKNRTRVDSETGVGINEGLRILSRVKKDLGLKVTTDVHETIEVGPTALIADLLQVPSFLSRQTELILACARSGKPVNVKKGQFMSPSDTQYLAEKLRVGGCKQFFCTERGTSFGHNALVVDFSGFPEIRRYIPLIFDATHSVQKPASENGITGGNRDLIEPMARAAIAVGCDGLFFETIFNPDSSPSDAQNIYDLTKFEGLLKRLLVLEKAVPKIIL